MFDVVLTSGFKKELKHIAKKHKSILADVNLLIDQLAKNPTIGNDLGRNVFKIRLSISSSSKGKSGGARIITYVKIIAQTVILAEIYLKNEYHTVDMEGIIKRLKQEEFI